MMRAIYIPELRQAPDQTRVLDVKEYLPDLESLTPVQGTMKVSHCGNYIEVEAQVETIVTLTCNRCLQQYNHRLKADTKELIWLQDELPEVDQPGVEIEVPLEDLVETLPPKGYFQPADWLYQQLCLALPARQLCDRNCPGIDTSNAEAQSLVDSRWSALEILKQQLSNN
ncbi:MAG: YceD family protein [Thainema sp.]